MDSNFKLSLRALFFLVLTFALVLSAPAQNKSAETKPKTNTNSETAKLAEVRRAVDAGNAKWIEAWAKSDAEMIVSTFSDDGIQLRPDGSVVKGHEQIRETIKSSMKRLGSGVVLNVETTTVWLNGETAYETGKSVYKYTEKGEPKTYEFRYVSIWKRQRDGTWKLYMDMGVPKD